MKQRILKGARKLRTPCSRATFGDAPTPLRQNSSISKTGSSSKQQRLECSLARQSTEVEKASQFL